MPVALSKRNANLLFSVSDIGDLEQIINLFSYSYYNVISQLGYTAVHLELSMARSPSWPMMSERVLMCQIIQVCLREWLIWGLASERRLESPPQSSQPLLSRHQLQRYSGIFVASCDCML